MWDVSRGGRLVSAVGTPAKSWVGGGTVAVLPGQLGIGVYPPLSDAKAKRARSSSCRSLSEQLGLHFQTVSRDRRATSPVYRPRDNIRVYETHGDLLFAGAEQVVRTVDRERDSFDVAVLDVSRVDDIDDAARALRSDMAAALHAEGKVGYLVDPDGVVIRDESEFKDLRYVTVDDAVAAAEEWLGRAFTR